MELGKRRLLAPALSSMASADALRRRLESLRFRGKWADVKGVAEDNDAIMAGGGFDLASDHPTAPVAALFKKHLASEEFRGAFEHVVFAILDPLGTGNLGPFKQEFGGK